MQARTILNFSYHGDLWHIVNQWAQEARLALEESRPDSRSYIKKSFFNAPVYIEIGYKDDGDAYAMGWVKSIRIGTFNVSQFLPAEIELRSGGLVGMVPRYIGRKIVNKLLTRLEQPLIP